jgi:hypothetical protein
MTFGTIKHTGIGTIKAKLRNIAQKVPDHAARTMRQGAENIVVMAKLQCPHDKGALEDSIHAEEMINEGNKRLAIDIVAGGVVDGVDVDQYAVQIHEHYEDVKPGPNTLAKMAANPGVVIGSKFIDRAVDNSEAPLIAKMIEATVQVIREEL